MQGQHGLHPQVEGQAEPQSRGQRCSGYLQRYPVDLETSPKTDRPGTCISTAQMERISEADEGFQGTLMAAGGYKNPEQAESCLTLKLDLFNMVSRTTPVQLGVLRKLWKSSIMTPSTNLAEHRQSQTHMPTLGWLTGSQWGGIYGSPTECLGMTSDPSNPTPSSTAALTAGVWATALRAFQRTCRVGIHVVSGFKLCVHFQVS